MRRRQLLLTGAATLLAACHGARTIRPLATRSAPPTDHELLVLPLQRFAFEARAAVSDGQEGGSGQLHWQQSPGHVHLRFSAGLANRGFELRGTPHGAELIESSGRTKRADDIDQLLRQAWDVQVPLQALGYWLRGAREPEQFGSLALDEEGRPRQLQQHGWTVDYLRWQAASDLGPSLPTKLYAQRERQWVRLAIRNWDLSAAD